MTRVLIPLAATVAVFAFPAHSRGQHWTQCPDGSWVKKWDYDKLCTTSTSDSSTSSSTDTAQTSDPAPALKTSTSSTSTSSSTSTGYAEMATGSNGLAPKSFNWLGRTWTNRNGMVWNTKVPYAVRLASGAIRFELHDTPNDRGPNDADFKRRAEIGTSVAWPNGKDIWFAFSVKDVITGGDLTKLGQTVNQFQSTDGSSPAFANRLQYCGDASPSKVCLVQTTRLTGGSTKTVGKGAYSLGEWHDVVNHVRFSSTGNGIVETWLDGKLITRWTGSFGGSDGLRLGDYGAPLAGMTHVREYKNISAFPSTTDLSGRVANPPV